MPPSWPPSDSTQPSTVPISLNQCLQVSLETQTIISPISIRSRPPTASPISVDYCLQVRTTMACNCIFKLAQFQPPSSYADGLLLYIQTPSIMASNRVSKLGRLQPQTVSPNSLDHHLQVYPELVSPTTCTQSILTVYRWIAIFIRRYTNTLISIHTEYVMFKQYLLISSNCNVQAQLHCLQRSRYNSLPAIQCNTVLWTLLLAFTHALKSVACIPRYAKGCSLCAHVCQGLHPAFPHTSLVVTKLSKL